MYDALISVYGASGYKFTGKERDSESGLDNFGARYNSSSMGRFMSPDPKIVSKQRMLDPQQWNMYSYTRNNPLLYVDPDGNELKIYILNNTSYSDRVASQIGQKAAGRYREAGVKNVSVQVVHDVPKGVGDGHTVVSELIDRGSQNRPGDGQTGVLPADYAGKNLGDGKSIVDVNYHYEPGQGVNNVVNNEGSDVQHETAHEFVYGTDGQPKSDPNNPRHSPDPNSPMAPGDQVNDKPFTPAEQKVLQEKLNRPDEKGKTQ